MQNPIKKTISALPDSPGVYLFKDSRRQVIYVGKATNLKKRVASYFQNKIATGEKTRILVSNIANLDHIKVDSEIEALLLEANLIQKFKPKFNIELKDDKSYPYIKITTNEKFPKILQTRKVEKDRAKYFGPYPDVPTLKFILKYLRKMFMFRTCRALPKTPCLFYHIGKCQAPCIFRTEKEAKEYKKYIKNVILFLEGKKDLVIKNLEKSMEMYAKAENFEKADKARKQIEKIKLFTAPVTAPNEYLENPNLLEDQTGKSLETLKEELKKYFPELSNLSRIECYDVSTISGKSSTASMIVFSNGQKDTDSYRHFKIRSEGKPNDYEMLKETLKRRFNHQEWPNPYLIIIDGGKGQLTTTLEVIRNMNLSFPIVALAKREEEIFLRTNGKIIKLRLDRFSQALKLLQRIRDEAHRFAISYHKKLRERFLTKENILANLKP